MRRLCVIFALLAILVVGGRATAGAVDYPPTIKVEGTTIHPQDPTDVVKPTSGSGLPFTGGDAMPLTWIAVACITAGTLVIVRARRRRTSDL